VWAYDFVAERTYDGWPLKILTVVDKYSRECLALGPEDETPLSFKIVGAVSLICWFGVLYFGRILPYFQPGLTSNLWHLLVRLPEDVDSLLRSVRVRLAGVETSTVAAHSKRDSSNYCNSWIN